MKDQGIVTELRDIGQDRVQMFYAGLGCVLTKLEAKQVAVGDLCEVETDRLNRVFRIKINDKVIRETPPEQFF